MPDSKISELTEGTVVDLNNDFLVYVNTSDATQNPITGTTKRIRAINLLLNQIDGGTADSVYGGTTAINGGTP